MKIRSIRVAPATPAQLRAIEEVDALIWALWELYEDLYQSTVCSLIVERDHGHEAAMQASNACRRAGCTTQSFLSCDECRENCKVARREAEHKYREAIAPAVAEVEAEYRWAEAELSARLRTAQLLAC